jgi:hypothetical protein
MLPSFGEAARAFRISIKDASLLPRLPSWTDAEQAWRAASFFSGLQMSMGCASDAACPGRPCAHATMARPHGIWIKRLNMRLFTPSPRDRKPNPPPSRADFLRRIHTTGRFDITAGSQALIKTKFDQELIAQPRLRSAGDDLLLVWLLPATKTRYGRALQGLGALRSGLRPRSVKGDRSWVL